MTAPAETPGTSAQLLRPVLRLLGALDGHRPMFIRSTLSMTAFQLAAAAAAALSAYAAATAATGPDGVDLAWILLGGLGIALIAHGVFVWIESWLAHVLAYKVLDGLRLRLHDAIERLTPNGMRRRRAGEVAGATMADIESLEWFYAHTVGAAMNAVAVPLAVTGALIALHPPSGLIALAGVVLLLAVPWLAGPVQARQGKAVRDEIGELKAVSLEGAEGLREMLSLGLEDRQRGRILDATARIQRRKRAFALRAGAEAAAAEFVAAASMVAFALVLAAAVRSGDVPAALFPAGMVLLAAAFAPAASVLPMFQRLGEMSAAAARVLGVVDAPANTADPRDSVDPNGDAGIRFENVSFQYEDAIPVLRRLDFTVRPGEHVALVGASGAGKTTAAHLLVRFWDPVEGRVLLGGDDLKDLGAEALRRRVGLVSQNPYVFRGTLRSNLLLARPDASAAEVRRALDRARLADTVADLPEGLDTAVGENGASLSGGQRQRLSIAQALLREPDVLILDEAAAHLDAIGEKEMTEAVAEAMRGRTTLVIAHRVSTIRRADRVLFLKDGAIAATGTHRDLVEGNEDYRRLLAGAEDTGDLSTVV
ncbi:ABC transporter ATP-binding protein [Salininema proteolyticum]|uniref:ABC transporter ATP-binding protein n=1 Tax=Salininema proteolyticum TaxID=1607685 RepID=A0ABV8TUQ7_9ACTN